MISLRKRGDFFLRKAMKRLLIFFLAAAVALAVLKLPKAPSFDERGTYTLYRYNASSLATEERLKGNVIFDARSVKGESVTYFGDAFLLSDVLEKYGATLLFSEEVGDVICYYAYSPVLPYRATLYGKTVNLQIATENQRITLGTPLIFGSF